MERNENSLAIILPSSIILTRSLEYFLVATTETVAVQWNNAPDLLVVREEKQNENNKVKWKWMERDFFGSLEREIPSLWISLF